MQNISVLITSREKSVNKLSDMQGEVLVIYNVVSVKRVMIKVSLGPVNYSSNNHNIGQ